MYYEAYIRFVNAHSEGYRSHDDVNALHEEVVLRLRTRSRVESGMIRCRLDVIGLEHGSQFFHLLARDAIDDATLSVMLLDELYYLSVDVLCLLPYLII